MARRLAARGDARDVRDAEALLATVGLSPPPGGGQFAGRAAARDG